MFVLWNNTDNVPASPAFFNTEADAEVYAVEFRKRYEGQGFYLTAAGERISPENIELVVIHESEL